MSTRPGGGPKRGPKHQNRTAFKHNPHSTKSLKIDALPNEGLCSKCSEIIEWKKKYHKFKPLTVPRACQVCRGKTVIHAYHVLCVQCSREKQLCAKCCEPRPIVAPVVTPEERKREQDHLDDAFSKLKLSQKRTWLRKIAQGESPVPNPEEADDDDDDEEEEEEDDDGEAPK